MYEFQFYNEQFYNELNKFIKGLDLASANANTVAILLHRSLYFEVLNTSDSY